MERGLLLHVGCGDSPLPSWLRDYKEIRSDIDEVVKPDIVASMTDLGDIGTFDAVYSSHCLEHVFPHEVHKALTEFRRVLNENGYVICYVPDLEDVKPDNEVLFESPAGPIMGLDLYYGHRAQLEENPYMQHKTGFTKETLTQAFEKAGYSKIDIKRIEPYALIAIGVK